MTAPAGLRAFPQCRAPSPAFTAIRLKGLSAEALDAAELQPGRGIRLRSRLRSGAFDHAVRCGATALVVEEQLRHAWSRTSDWPRCDAHYDAAAALLTVHRGGKPVARGALRDPDRPGDARRILPRLPQGRSAGATPAGRLRRRPMFFDQPEPDSRLSALRPSPTWSGWSVGRWIRFAFAPTSMSTEYRPGRSSSGSAERLASARRAPEGNRAHWSLRRHQCRPGDRRSRHDHPADSDAGVRPHRLRRARRRHEAGKVARGRVAPSTPEPPLRRPARAASPAALTGRAGLVFRLGFPSARGGGAAWPSFAVGTLRGCSNRW